LSAAARLMLRGATDSGAVARATGVRRPGGPQPKPRPTMAPKTDGWRVVRERHAGTWGGRW